MAYTLIEGFDHYGSQADMATAGQWPVLPAGEVLALVPGFYASGRALRVPNASTAHALLCEPASAEAEVIIAFDVLLEQLPTTNPSLLVACREGWQTHGNLAITTTGAIRMRRATTQLGSDSAFVLALNTRYRVEMRTLIADAGGLIEVRVDGVSVASVSGVDTRDAGAAGVCSRLELRGMTQSSNVGATIFDNLTINSTTGVAPTSFPGARRIETLFPDADVVAQWTPSEGALNFEMVRAATPNLLRWVQSNSAGQQDRYGLGLLSGTPTAIDAVQLAYRAARSDNVPRTIRGILRSGATTANGATVTPPATPSGQYHRSTWHADPNTAAAWDAAGVNALEIGVEVVT